MILNWLTTQMPQSATLLLFFVCSPENGKRKIVRKQQRRAAYVLSCSTGRILAIECTDTEAGSERGVGVSIHCSLVTRLGSGCGAQWRAEFPL